MSKFKLYDRVKRSAYALQPLRDAWQLEGEYTRKNQRKRWYETAKALRGIVIRIDVEQNQEYPTVRWNDDITSSCLDYMIELATD